MARPLGLLLAVAMAASTLVLVWGLVVQRSAVPANRLAVGGTPYFWAGVNYPWKTGQDFGTGGWGHGGVSNPTTYQEIDADFAGMAARGVRVVKWRVFSDGRYSPEFDADGFVTGLDEKFFPDLDAALEIASRHQMYLVLTLLDSGFWATDCRSGDVQMGGHAETLLDPAKRRSLVERAVVPMLQHLRRSDRVLAYEIIAEPEWGVEELHQDQDGRIKVPLAAVRDLVARVATAIHRNTRSLATVESNRASHMRYWQGLGLDYYSFSWYDWLEPYEPLATPASAFGLDRPIVVGEFPAEQSAYYQLPQVLDLTYSLGYAGAFAWSFWSGDGFGRWREAAPAFAQWVRSRWSEVGVGGMAPPPDDGAAVDPEQLYPYRYYELEVQSDNGSILVELKVTVASGEPYLARAYLYEVGSPRPVQEVRMSASRTRPGKLAARFAPVEEGKPYRVSLGIFDRAQVLLKWFDSIQTFVVMDGQVNAAKLDPLQQEVACRR